MPGNVQIHRKVLLNDEKISKETKTALYTLLQKYDTIILKSDDIGQTDLIEMYIAARPDAAPIAAQLYPLALKHLDFLKQEIKNLLDAGIIHKNMSPWASPIVVVKNTHTRRYTFGTCISSGNLDPSCCQTPCMLFLTST